MGINKVMYGSKTVIDLSGSTVAPDKMLEGIIGYNGCGRRGYWNTSVPGRHRNWCLCMGNLRYKRRVELYNKKFDKYILSRWL